MLTAEAERGLLSWLLLLLTKEATLLGLAES